MRMDITWDITRDITWDITWDICDITWDITRDIPCDIPSWDITRDIPWCDVPHGIYVISHISHWLSTRYVTSHVISVCLSTSSFVTCYYLANNMSAYEVPPPLPNPPTNCNRLHHTATDCTTLQQTARRVRMESIVSSSLQIRNTHCNRLRH